MAKDPILEKIERQFEPEAGEGTTGFITAQDLKDAFGYTFTALDEVELVARGDTFSWAMLNTPVKGSGATLLEVLYNNRNVLAALESTARASGVVDAKKGAELPVPTVKGNPLDSSPTVAQTAGVLNSLIEALVSVGLVVDARAPLATGIVAPDDATNPFLVGNPGNTQWAFTPIPSSVPEDLAALQAALTLSPSRAFTAAEFASTGDGVRQTWDGAAWSNWVPTIAFLIPPSGTGAMEWFFGPAGYGLTPPQVIGDLTTTIAVEADGSAVNMVSGNFVTLGDNTHAFWDGAAWVAGQKP